MIGDFSASRIFPSLEGQQRRASQTGEQKRGSVDHGARRASLKVSIAALAEKGDYDAVESMLKVTPTALDCQDSQGSTALMKAIRYGHTEITLMLLKRGADVNILDQNHDNAVTICALHGSIDVARVLLFKGADINVSNKTNYNTALFEAIKNGRSDMAELLAQHDGLDIHAVHRLSNDTALIAAAELGQLNVVKVLVGRGADIQMKNQWGHNAVMRAVARSNDEVAIFLAKHGADIYATELAGKNCLDFLKQYPLKQQDLIKAYEWGLADRIASNRLQEEPQHVQLAMANGLCFIYVALYIYREWKVSTFDISFGLLQNSLKKEFHRSFGRGLGIAEGASTASTPFRKIETVFSARPRTPASRGVDSTANTSPPVSVNTSGTATPQQHAHADFYTGLQASASLNQVDEVDIFENVPKQLDVRGISFSKEQYDILIAGLRADTHFEEIYISGVDMPAATAKAMVDAMENNETVKAFRCGAHGLDFDLSKSPPVWHVDAKYLTGCDVSVLAAVILRWPALLESVNDRGTVAVLNGGGISSPVSHPILEAFVALARIPDFDFRRLSLQQRRSLEEKKKRRSSSGSISLLSETAFLRRRSFPVAVAAVVEASEQTGGASAAGTGTTTPATATSTPTNSTIRLEDATDTSQGAQLRRHSSLGLGSNDSSTPAILREVSRVRAAEEKVHGIGSGSMSCDFTEGNVLSVSVNGGGDGGGGALVGGEGEGVKKAAAAAGTVSFLKRRKSFKDIVQEEVCPYVCDGSRERCVFDMHQHAFWFVLVAYDEFAPIAKCWAQLRPYLIHVTDHLGRKLLTQATNECRKSITSLFLIYERYLLSKQVPEYMSRHCEVYLATDEMSPTRCPVVLKFMQDRQRWQAEIDNRSKHRLDRTKVIDIHRVDEKMMVYGVGDMVKGYSRVKKGSARYPYCVVFPAGERSLQSIMAKEVIAGEDWEAIKSFAKSVAEGLMELHSHDLVHGDLKPAHVMRIGTHLVLIDIDSSVAIGQPIGWQYSSGFIPPEMVYLQEMTVPVSEGDSESSNPPTDTSDSDNEDHRVHHHDYDTKVEGKARAQVPVVIPMVRAIRLKEEGSPLGSMRAIHLKEEGSPLGSMRAIHLKEEGSPLGSVKAKAAVEGEGDGSSSLTHKLLPYTPLAASPSFDMWSFGCLLYFLCCGESLWQMDNFDNLDEDNLLLLAHWPPELKYRKLSKVKDYKARNLIAQLLNVDPTKRPSAARALTHPFLSGKESARLVGEEPEYDVFLSYRVNADLDVASRVYRELTDKGVKVFWDKKSLKHGVPWEKGFTEGLAKSRTFVPLMSRNAVNHPSVSAQNFAQITPTSKCDNVLFEMRMALELRDFGLIDRIFPVFVGDRDDDKDLYNNYFSSGCHCADNNVVNLEIESKLHERMEQLGLGTPMRENATVTDVTHGIVENQGSFIEGDPEEAFARVVCQIVNMVQEAKVQHIYAEGLHFVYKDFHNGITSALNARASAISRKLLATPSTRHIKSRCMSDNSGSVDVAADNFQNAGDGVEAVNHNGSLNDNQNHNVNHHHLHSSGGGTRGALAARDEHIRQLEDENSCLKLEVESLRKQLQGLKTGKFTSV